MQIGTMLHHKYFNGVVPTNRSSVYKDRVTGFTQSFGMRGTGIFAMVAPKGPSPDSYEWRNVDKIVEFCERNKVDVGYLITRGMADMRALRLGKHTVMKIPAALACFWLSK